MLVVSIRQHIQAEAHTRSQTRGVREPEEMRARCSFLIPAPQGSTCQYEYFSSLALTCTFFGCCFRWRTFLESAAGVTHPGLPIRGIPTAGTVSVKKNSQIPARFSRFCQNLTNFAKFREKSIKFDAKNDEFDRQTCQIQQKIQTKCQIAKNVDKILQFS